MKMPSTVLMLYRGHNFHTKILRGIILLKNVNGVAALHLSTLPDNALYLYQISRKYLRGFHSYSANTIFLLIFSKRHNSFINIGEVNVLVLYTSSDDA